MNCKSCGNAFPESALNPTGDGSMCSPCLEMWELEADLKAARRSELTLPGGALGLAFLANAVSFRSAETISVALGGHAGQQTTHLSLDPAGLAFGALAIVLALYALGRVPTDSWQRYASLGLISTALAVSFYALYDSLPRTVTSIL